MVLVKNWKVSQFMIHNILALIFVIKTVLKLIFFIVSCVLFFTPSLKARNWTIIPGNWKFLSEGENKNYLFRLQSISQIPLLQILSFVENFCSGRRKINEVFFLTNWTQWLPPVKSGCISDITKKTQLRKEKILTRKLS